MSKIKVPTFNKTLIKNTIILQLLLEGCEITTVPTKCNNNDSIFQCNYLHIKPANTDNSILSKLKLL